MGVKFGRIKVTTTTDDNGITHKAFQEYYDSTLPDLSPIVGITRFIPEGRAKKVSQPYAYTTNGKRTFRTIRQPMGQEGWTIKIQCTLRYREEIEYDEVATWLTVNCGEILLIKSNCCNWKGEVDTANHKPYTDLTDGTLWYVDHILISSKEGITDMTDMELSLVRCWEMDE